MQIHITMMPGMEEIDSVTVDAVGVAEGKALLAKLMLAPKPEPTIGNLIKEKLSDKEPSVCTLREAAELFRQMSQLPVTVHRAEDCLQLAELLDQLANGDKKIRTIKAVRMFSGLGLRDAKELIERVGPFRGRD